MAVIGYLLLGMLVAGQLLLWKGATWLQEGLPRWILGPKRYAVLIATAAGIAVVPLNEELAATDEQDLRAVRVALQKKGLYAESNREDVAMSRTGATKAEVKTALEEDGFEVLVPGEAEPPARPSLGASSPQPAPTPVKAQGRSGSSGGLIGALGP